MKKLLGLLGSFSLVTTGTSTIVSCSNKEDTPKTTESEFTKRVGTTIFSNLLKVKDVVLTVNDTENQKIITEAMIVDLNTIKDETILSFSYEGVKYIIQKGTFKIESGSRITVDIKESTNLDVTLTETIDWNSRISGVSNIVEMKKFAERKIFLKIERDVQKYDVSSLFTLQGVYTGNINFTSKTAIDLGETNKGLVAGSVDFSDLTNTTNKIYTTLSDYSVSLNVYDETVIADSLTAKTWKSNTYLNGVTTYDGVYGLVPSSLHDAISLLDGGKLTGDYVIYKEITGDFAIEADTEEEATGNAIMGGFQLYNAVDGTVTDISDGDAASKYGNMTSTLQSYFTKYYNGVTQDPKTLKWVPNYKLVDPEAVSPIALFESLGFFNNKEAMKNKIDALNARNHEKGYSMIKYSSSTGFYVKEISGTNGIISTMKAADGKTSVEEAAKAAENGMGDAFNWGRNLSVAHNLADFFNKYVHDGEKTLPSGEKVNATYKQFSAVYGEETLKYTIKGTNPLIKEEKELKPDYYGYKNQGIEFELEDINKPGVKTILSISMDEFFAYNKTYEKVKGDVVIK